MKQSLRGRRRGEGRGVSVGSLMASGTGHVPIDRGAHRNQSTQAASQRVTLPDRDRVLACTPYSVRAFLLFAACVLAQNDEWLNSIGPYIA